MAKKDLIPVAKSLYVDGRQSLRQIARTLGVGLTTMLRWKAVAAQHGDDWDAHRAEAMLAAQGSEAMARQNLGRFSRQYALVMDSLEQETGLTAVERVKVMSSLSYAYRQMLDSHGVAVPADLKRSVAKTVLVKLGHFLHANFPQAAAGYLEWVGPFGDALERDDG